MRKGSFVSLNSHVQFNSKPERLLQERLNESKRVFVCFLFITSACHILFVVQHG